MFGRFLCFLGIHKWEWHYETAANWTIKYRVCARCGDNGKDLRDR